MDQIITLMADSFLQPDSAPVSGKQPEVERSRLQDCIHEVVGLFMGESSPKAPGQTDYRAEFEHYAGEALKTAPLFIPAVGRAWAIAGYGTAALFQAADQVHANDSASKQMLDFGLGATKGALTKYSFNLLGSLNYGAVNKVVDAGLVPKALSGAPLEITAKAFSFGISNRLLDTSLTSNTWLDNSGKFDVAGGIGTTFSNTFNKSMLITDVAVFAGAPLLLKGANVALRGALERSSAAQTIAAGSSFGLLSGSLNEVQRQNQQDSHYDLSKIAMRGFLQAGATGLGAIPGGLRVWQLSSATVPEAPRQSQSIPAADSWQSTVPIEESIVSQRFSPVHTGGRDEIFSLQPEFAADASKANMPEGAHSELVNETAKAPANLLGDSPELLLGIKASEHIGTHIDPAEGALFGAKQYRTENGQEFWQLTNGSIYYETSAGDGFARPNQNIWVPQGSDRQSGKLAPDKVTVKDADEKNAHSQEKVRQLTLDERHGILRDVDGQAHYGYTRANYFNQPEDLASRPKVTSEALDKLALVAPRAERDWQAELRLIPAEDGQPYESSAIGLWRAAPGPDRLNGKPGPNLPESYSAPGRVYRVLTEQQSVVLADLREQLSRSEITQDAYNEQMAALRNQATQILVPEDYGRRLDALRDLRKVATLSPEMLPEESERILQARRDLFTSTYRDRLVPEQIGQFMEGLPDRSMIDRLYLLDGDSKQYTARLTIAAADARSDLGRLRLFEASSSATDPVREILMHEWTHLAEKSNSDYLKIYEAAREIEPFAGRPYGKTNLPEHWAVNLGEMFLDPDPELFHTLAQAAPIKTLILAQAMKRTLSKAPEGQGSAYLPEIQRRLAEVEELVVPRATKQLNTMISSVDCDNIVSASRLIRTMNTNEVGRELLGKLLDKKELLSLIDSGSSDKMKAGQFDWEASSRRLLRLDLLKEIDPQAFQARRALYDSTLATTQSFTKTFLLSPDLPQQAQALKLAKALAGTKTDRPLLDALFPTAELALAALDKAHPEAAKEAFAALTAVGAQLRPVSDIAYDLLNADSPAKLAAARFLLEDSQSYGMQRGIARLSEQIDKGVPEIASKELAQTLSESIDKVVDTVEFHAVPVLRTLMRGTLLEKLVNAKPELLDQAMQERLGYLNKLKMMTRDWLADGLEPNTSPDHREAALAELKFLSDAKDPGLVNLTKELAPRMVLEQAIRLGTVQDPRILTLEYSLYGSQSHTLLLELSRSDNPLRATALRHIVNSSDTRLLEQALPLLKQFEAWGNENARHELLQACAGMVDWGAKQSKLVPETAERMRMRLEIMQHLISPMRMDLQPALIERLQASIDAGNRRLEEMRAAATAQATASQAKSASST
jgi:hypothetical protein